MIPYLLIPHKSGVQSWLLIQSRCPCRCHQSMWSPSRPAQSHLQQKLFHSMAENPECGSAVIPVLDAASSPQDLLARIEEEKAQSRRSDREQTCYMRVPSHAGCGISVEPFTISLGSAGSRTSCVPGLTSSPLTPPLPPRHFSCLPPYCLYQRSWCPPQRWLPHPHLPWYGPRATQLLRF